MLATTQKDTETLINLSKSYELPAKDILGMIIQVLKAQEDRMQKLEDKLLEVSRANTPRKTNTKPSAKTQSKASQKVSQDIEPLKEAEAS